MSLIKAFIFDLDGVLVDTAKYHFKAWKALANELGIDFSEKENEQLKGVSRKESLEMILSWGGISKAESEKQELMKLKNEWYLEHIKDMNPDELLGGVREFLQETKDMGLKIALGSASKNALPILEKTDILHFFDAVVDGNKTTKSKPDPQVFLMGADQLDVKPEEAVVFEDSVAGVDAACNGQFKTIGIGEENILGRADRVIQNLEGITPTALLNEL